MEREGRMVEAASAEQVSPSEPPARRPGSMDESLAFLGHLRLDTSLSTSRPESEVKVGSLAVAGPTETNT
ncbi:Protein of unknown function [Gryllus bimaculatus]|nr:Protein of unknown function [Gryllus bimaculatus]